MSQAKRNTFVGWMLDATLSTLSTHLAQKNNGCPFTALQAITEFVHHSYTRNTIPHQVPLPIQNIYIHIYVYVRPEEEVENG